MGYTIKLIDQLIESHHHGGQGGLRGPGMRSRGPTVGSGGARARARGGQRLGPGGARAGARGGHGPPGPPVMATISLTCSTHPLHHPNSLPTKLKFTPKSHHPSPHNLSKTALILFSTGLKHGKLVFRTPSVTLLLLETNLPTNFQSQTLNLQ